MTSKSETVSRQNLLAGNIVKSMTTESNGHPGCQALFMRGFGVKRLQPWRRPVTDEAFRGKRRTQKKPLIPKVQNGLFQARISLLAKCPSNEEGFSLGGCLTKERGGGNEKWDPTV